MGLAPAGSRLSAPLRATSPGAPGLAWVGHQARLQLRPESEGPPPVAARPRSPGSCPPSPSSARGAGLWPAPACAHAPARLPRGVRQEQGGGARAVARRRCPAVFRRPSRVACSTLVRRLRRGLLRALAREAHPAGRRYRAWPGHPHRRGRPHGGACAECRLVRDPRLVRLRPATGAPSLADLRLSGVGYKLKPQIQRPMFTEYYSTEQGQQAAFEHLPCTIAATVANEEIEEALEHAGIKVPRRVPRFVRLALAAAAEALKVTRC